MVVFGILAVFPHCIRNVGVSFAIDEDLLGIGDDAPFELM